MISRSLFHESKKLMVWDFDDVLVRTKSHIYVNHPNKKTKKLTPGEYAVYKPKSGDEFDFSDFNIVKDPTEIKRTTQDLRKAVKKLGGKGIYVLTARAIFPPIQQYLKDIGLGNKVRVIALSTAEPDQKSEWIEFMIDEKGYDEVYFADDSKYNVKAVKDMLVRKGIPHKVELIKEKKQSTKLKDILLEATPSYFKTQVEDGKKVFKVIQKMYPEIPKFPLKFSNLRGRSGGYIQTTKYRGQKSNIKTDFMMVDNSGQWGVDPDYVICHEFSHVILAWTKGSLGHTKAHENLTYKLAKKFGLV